MTATLACRKLRLVFEDADAGLSRAPYNAWVA